MEQEEKMMEWDKEYTLRKDRKSKWIERGVGLFVVFAMILGWVWSSGSVNSAQNEKIKFNKGCIDSEVVERKSDVEDVMELISTNTKAIKVNGDNTIFIIGQLDVLLKANGLVYKPKKETEK